jgi:hypothetical protein
VELLETRLARAGSNRERNTAFGLHEDDERASSGSFLLVAGAGRVLLHVFPKILCIIPLSLAISALYFRFDIKSSVIQSHWNE